MAEVTQLLRAIDAGDALATARLFPIVYDELRRLAEGHMRAEKVGHSLNATALVHETWLRLVPDADEDATYADRRHFFAAAAEAMRRILIESARRRNARKRGGDVTRNDVDQLDLAVPEPREDLLALDEALERLAVQDAQAAQLVQLRYFGGFNMLDAAEIMAVSPRTAHRLWAYAKAYLHRELKDIEAAGGE